MKSIHATNHRLVILSSLLWERVERHEPKSRKREFRGFPLYYTDYKLSSFHALESHWLLSAINVHERIIAAIDPYSLDFDGSHLAKETILSCVKHMLQKHDSDYVICRNWTIVPHVLVSETEPCSAARRQCCDTPTTIEGVDVHKA